MLCWNFVAAAFVVARFLVPFACVLLQVLVRICLPSMWCERGLSADFLSASFHRLSVAFDCVLCSSCRCDVCVSPFSGFLHESLKRLVHPHSSSVFLWRYWVVSRVGYPIFAVKCFKLVYTLVVFVNTSDEAVCMFLRVLPFVLIRLISCCSAFGVAA